MRTITVLALVAIVGSTTFAIAQTNHNGPDETMDHDTHMQSNILDGSPLTEPGQGAFAALSEVVRVLETDPTTDWAKVDLGGLRAHLVDMDRLISDTVVTETQVSGGISAVATGDADTLATLRRMVPAHAAQLSNDDRWTVTTSETETGIELRVTSDVRVVIERIRGLGFFGLMASQDHHREHHMMMARGENAHGH